MFTGIIETTGKITDITESGTNKTFTIQSQISSALKIDQSVSHNGVCLTVIAVAENTHQVTAIEETLLKTNLGSWQTGRLINLERCLPVGGRLDGHIVQGHVDATAVCRNIADRQGSFEITFETDPSFATHMIEKGSICVNGISLTLFNVTASSFTVAIIPYTWNHTNLQELAVGNTVNIEFDVIGKYVQRIAAFANN